MTGPALLWWVLSAACTPSGCLDLPPMGPMAVDMCREVRAGIVRPVAASGAPLLPSFWIEARCSRAAGPDPP